MGKTRANRRAPGTNSRGKGQRSSGTPSPDVGGGHGDAKSGIGSTDAVQQRPTEVVMHLTAADSFFEAAPTAAIENTAKVQTVDPESGSFEVTLGKWTHAAVRNLAEWFRKGLAGDPAAVLKFPSYLNKGDRRLVHKLSEVPGTPLLDTLSQGVGEERHMLLLAHGSPLKAEAEIVLQGSEDHKAMWIHKWGRDAQLEVSIGEVREMIKNGTLTPDLQELWATKSAAQKAVMRLLEAIGSLNHDALTAATEEAPDVVKAGAYDVATGMGPLHFAASKGDVAAMNMLLEAGAPVDGLDGSRMTALEVSRKEEQCEAEGVLLRAGAKDPLAAVLPVIAAEPNPDTPQDEESVSMNGSTDVPALHANSHVEAPTEASPPSPAKNGPSESLDTAKAPADATGGHVSQPKGPADPSPDESAGQNGSAIHDGQDGSADEDGQQGTPTGQGVAEQKSTPACNGASEVSPEPETERPTPVSDSAIDSESEVDRPLASEGPAAGAGVADEPLTSALVEAAQEDTNDRSDLQGRLSLDERASAASAESEMGSAAYLAESVPDAASADDLESDADIPTTPGGPAPDETTIGRDAAALSASRVPPASPSAPRPARPATPEDASETQDTAEPLPRVHSGAERAYAADAEDRDGAQFDGASSTGAYAATGSICGVSDLGSTVNSDGEEGSAAGGEDGSSPRRDRSLKGGLATRDPGAPAALNPTGEDEAAEAEEGEEAPAGGEAALNVGGRAGENAEIVAAPAAPAAVKKPKVESPFSTENAQDADEEGSLWSILGMEPPSSSTLIYAGIAMLGVGVAALTLAGSFRGGRPRFH